jgi:hypothetical protein
MPLSATISTGLVKGRFGDRVVAGPNGEKLLIPARGRIEFEGMTPFSSFPLATPDPITMLRPRGSGILDGEGYLCTLDPADEDKPGERMVLLQAPNDPDSTVQGWTWRATLRFVNADGTRVQHTLETFTFDLPFGDVPFDLAQVVSVPESPGIGKEQAIIYAASAQAAAVSAADDAEAARKDADVSAAAAVSAAAGVEGARADAESARVDADRAVGLIATAEGSAGAAASSAARAELEASAAKVAANAASAAAGRSADESAAARSVAGTAVTASAEAVSTASSAKTVAAGVESRANAGEFKGAKGDTGPVNKLTIGTVAKADTASATITGTAPNQTLNLQLPKGDVGPAVALSIGTVTSGANAAASLTGSGANQALNLTLPKGDTGGWASTVLEANFDANTVLTPNLYSHGVATTAASNVPILGIAGHLFVYNINRQTTLVTQVWKPFPHTQGVERWGRGEYTRMLNSQTWSPWRFTPSQRVDNSAGRAIYTWDDTANREQLVYGDTGLRNISADLMGMQPSTGNSYSSIRRENNTVTLSINAEVILADVSGSLEFYRIPAGFRNSFQQINAYAVVKTSPVTIKSMQLVSQQYVRLYQDPKAGEQIRHTFTYQTNDPWPTVLPGV